MHVNITQIGFNHWIINGKSVLWNDGPKLPFYTQLRNSGVKTVTLNGKKTFSL